MRVLFTAISGTNIFVALTKVADSLSLKTKPVKFEDYLISAHETNLIGLHFSATYIKEDIERIKRPGGIQILLRYPKQYIRDTWVMAFDQMDSETKNLQDVLFSMHSIYYQTQNREFFRAFNNDKLKQFKVDKVITLVDDIYDSHARLRVENGVMSDESAEKEYADPHERARARINDLFTILDWRSKEIMAAEQLASVLGKKHFVIAVKHPVSVIESLLLFDSSLVYISHPITQVRKLMQQERTSEAKQIVRQISELTAALIENHKETVTAIFPTSIDELIVRRKGEFPKCFPILNKRWPLLYDAEKLMYSTPELLSKNPLDIDHIYYDPSGNERKDVSKDQLCAIGILINDVLRPGIANHIDSRDHFLVDQCSAICVYRPYFDGNYSSGVSEEISHRTVRYRCRIDDAPKICVIYCPPEDLAKVRLMDLMEQIENETGQEFSVADREKMIVTAESDSKTWFRLRDLKPEEWNDKQAKALFTKAGIKVKPKGTLEKGPFRKVSGLQYLDFDYIFWNGMARYLNSHPLERHEVLLADVDIWREDEMSPQDFAKIVVNSIKK